MSEIERLKRENLHLKCVMAEAAFELRQYWRYHMSPSGVGPSTLLAYLSGSEEVSDVKNPYPNRVKEVLQK